jgi:hypothetical protein
MILFHLRNPYLSPESGGDQSGGGEPVAEAPTPIEVDVTPVVDNDAEENPVKEESTKESEKDKLPKKEDKTRVGKVTALVEQSGLDMKEVAEYAKANNGEVDLDTMVALKEKHGDAIAELIVDQIKGIHKEHSEAASKRDKEVYDQVQEAFQDVTDQSGEETWKELAAWSKENVSNEHRADINKLLAQGGLVAKLAVQELVSAFKESQGTQEFQEADLLEADNTAPSSTGGTISKSDYNRELNELLNKGHVYGQSAEIAKLDNRRAKSIQRGL